MLDKTTREKAIRWLNNTSLGGAWDNDLKLYKDYDDIYECGGALAYVKNNSEVILITKLENVSDSTVDARIEKVYVEYKDK